MVKFAIVFQRSTLGSKKFIKNTYFLYNICNCFIGYKNWRYRWNFNVIQKVIQNCPIDFWICAFVIKNIIFLKKLIFVFLIRLVHTLNILLSSVKMVESWPFL